MLTAALFVSALAVPAFAQSPAAEASPAMAAPSSETSPEMAAPMHKSHKHHWVRHHHHHKAMMAPSPEASPEASPSAS
ncbi:MAG: hypothetical protein IVW56_12370 [Candidatus Binataceae bacterium]|nr:hypothetical protein [Candidatus Binataceae bacterium]